MRKLMCAVCWLALLAGSSGCIDLGDQDLLPVGTPFVTTGTFTVSDVDGQPCGVWIGDNGVTYHLFQDPLLDNDLYDQVTTPGTSSRLVIVSRSDLEVDCQVGTIVEVEEILEVVP